MIKKGFSFIGIFFLYGLALLPLSVLYAFSTLTYYILYYLVGYRQQVVRENLINSFPEKDLPEIIKIEKAYFRYLCNLIFEIIKMPLISKKELQKRYIFKNLHFIENHLNKGESAIVCSAHYGNWEWGTLALGLNLSITRYVIYKPLNNKVFDSWFYNMRARFGNTLISMKQTLRTVAASRKTTSIICFASDQTPVRESANYWLPFLHQTTSVFTGPEKIARQTNRPVFYLQVTVIKRGYYEVDCVPITENPSLLEEHDITKAQFKLLEDQINANPPYWLWSHRRWKHKPENVAYEA
ncbi:lysophospholipid acyltransferase family protein [Pedobacter sp.]|uniref:lysophospholipid acyltransferase family protein n=1 Tax=Pedobacter sp. TaxID=1411316 RepID=UPI003D7F4875